MSAAAAAAPDRLSHLSDDLLTQILSFAPTREAVSTTALSRRWRRPLWLDTAAVNLDYRSYTTSTAGAVNFRWRAMDDADHAFALQRSHNCGPKKLTVHMRDDGAATYQYRQKPCAFASRRLLEDNEEEEDKEEDDAAVEAEEDTAGLVEEEDSGSGVKELRVEWLDHGCPCMTLMHALSPRSLPFATLRVLDLTGCYLRRHSEPRRVPFPCLEAMRLRRCRAPGHDLGGTQACRRPPRGREVPG